MRQKQTVQDRPVQSGSVNGQDTDVTDWLALPIMVLGSASMPIVGFSVLAVLGWSSDGYPMTMLVCGLAVFITVLGMLKFLVRRSKAKQRASLKTAKPSGKQAPQGHASTRPDRLGRDEGNGMSEPLVVATTVEQAKD